MKHSRLDPRTADVGFNYEPLGDYPRGEYCVGRVYYWSDPRGVEPAIGDDDFRTQHPEIDDDEWRQLFAQAFDRGEREFLEGLLQDRPELLKSESGRQAAFLGYTFGPCRPSEETLRALGLTPVPGGRPG